MEAAASQHLAGSTLAAMRKVCFLLPRAHRRAHRVGQARDAALQLVTRIAVFVEIWIGAARPARRRTRRRQATPDAPGAQHMGPGQFGNSDCNLAWETPGIQPYKGFKHYKMIIIILYIHTTHANTNTYMHILTYARIYLHVLHVSVCIHCIVCISCIV